MTPEQSSACKDCVQLPWALGATLASYNVKGAPAKLKLSGPVLADIFLGKITHWDDPAIAKLNPGATLPCTKITPVYRSDGSGDTYAFTDYLSKVSPEFEVEGRRLDQVKFPKGIGAKRTTAWPRSRRRTARSATSASPTRLQQTRLRAGPELGRAIPGTGRGNVTAAADAVNTIAKDNSISLPTCRPRRRTPTRSRPSRTSSCREIEQGEGAEEFITYAIGPGQKFGAQLHFAPLPARVVSSDKNMLAKLG